ncbi:MAG: DNA-binding protein [Flavobacterium sp.]|nr:MAG: DNA-binding protein [Flavobacterium sp.]
MTKDRFLNVEDTIISVLDVNNSDYISLTDMVKNEEGNDHIRNWMRNRNTVEFLGVWETLNNKNFKGVGFDTLRKEAGLNSFNLTPRKWIETTNASGIISKSGRGGGTYAHKDIAFEFGAWISPIFRLYVIKEYQRLKKVENDTYNLEWDVRRILTKANYHFHTDAVQNHIIPNSKKPKDKQWLEYAEEADLLNLAVFGCTAKEWRDANPQLVKDKKNIRDFASINELVVMGNMESLSAEMIKVGGSKEARFKLMKTSAKEQLEKLKDIDLIKSVRKQSKTTYIEAQEKTGEELELLTGKSILDKNKKALSDFNKKLKKGLEWNPKEHKK